MHSLLSLEEPLSESWKSIVDFLAHTDDKKSPTKAWFKELSGLIEAHVGKDAYESFLIDTLTRNKKPIDKLIYTPYGVESRYPLVKGLIHSCELFKDNKQIIDLIEDIGIAAFKDTNAGIPLGNDCLSVLSNLDVTQSVASLGKYRSRIKKPKVQSKIVTLLNALGKKHGKSADELEELATSNFGLNTAHELVETFGNWIATAYFRGEKKNAVEWTSGTKVQKSAPKEISTQYKVELKEFTENIKEIKEQLKSHTLRIELLYLKNRERGFGYWKQYYLDHPLVGIIAKNLIWKCAWDQQVITVMHTENGFVNSQQLVIDTIPEKAVVTLWHPIDSALEEVKNWRDYLTQQQLSQDFKQAFREVYLLTDAELHTQSYSNRYAAHIVKIATYLDHSRRKGWTGSVMIMDNFALKVPYYSLKAEYWIHEVKTEHDDMFGSGLGATDQVRFYKDKVQLDLVQVPKIVFSEVMRDIDLFISVASITNNPYWNDAGNTDKHHYWHKYSFGELRMSGKVRSEVLQNIVPKLLPKDTYSFDDTFLCVNGSLRKYKIHMGSGNILMTPNDQYLCIVRDSSATARDLFGDKVFLPFEGDETLSLIISKALLLVKDAEIVDPTIVRQINAA